MKRIKYLFVIGYRLNANLISNGDQKSQNNLYTHIFSKKNLLSNAAYSHIIIEILVVTF